MKTSLATRRNIRANHAAKQEVDAAQQHAQQAHWVPTLGGSIRWVHCPDWCIDALRKNGICFVEQHVLASAPHLNPAPGRVLGWLFLTANSTSVGMLANVAKRYFLILAADFNYV